MVCPRNERERVRMSKRPKIGDIVEIPVEGGFAYAQYVNYYREPPRYGPLLRIFTKIHRSRPRKIEGSLIGDHYFGFFPIAPAVRCELVSIVGTQSIPSSDRPRPTFRTYNVGKDGKKTSLFICDERGEQRVSSWTKAQREFSIKRIYTFPTLVKRIQDGYHPRQEV